MLKGFTRLLPLALTTRGSSALRQSRSRTTSLQRLARVAEVSATTRRDAVSLYSAVELAAIDAAAWERYHDKAGQKVYEELLVAYKGPPSYPGAQQLVKEPGSAIAEKVEATLKSEATACYTDDNPKTVYGDKKPDVSLVPPVAIIGEAMAFKLGADKYGPYNWRERTVSSRVYVAAILRHLYSWMDGEDLDPESGAHHLAHLRACAAILMDAQSIGKLNDNRPAKGAAAQTLKEFVK